MNPALANPSGPVIEMRGAAAGARNDPGVVVAEGVDWSVAPGDFWVVAGLQGSGKTDFLLMAGGLTLPLAGSSILFGKEMPAFGENRLGERLQAGFVFESGQLLNHLTVIENVSLPARYHRNLTPAEAGADARRLIEWTGLDAWADSTPGAMAPNWRKRAGLARALMLKPQVLLLDNPLGGLDPRHRRWVLGFLGELSRGHEWLAGRPMTIVATVDDPRPWRDFARQFAVLKDRRLVVLGPWESLESAQDETVRELLVASPPNADGGIGLKTSPPKP